MWDYIVVTCHRNCDTTRLKADLTLLQEQGVIDNKAKVVVLEDVCEGLGSGGATLNALLVLAEQLCVRNGFADLNADVLSHVKILIIHLGRSLSSVELSCGLVDLPVSFVTKDNFEAGVNTLVHLYRVVNEQLVPAVDLETYPVWVYGCDQLIYPTNVQIDWNRSNCDILAFSAHVQTHLTDKHGIYTFNKDTKILQNIEFGVEKGGGGDCSCTSVVLGLVCFKDTVAEHLLRLSLIQPIQRSTYIGIDTGLSGLKLSLFFDFLFPTCDRLDRKKYLSGETWPCQNSPKALLSSRTDSFDESHNDNSLLVRKVLWNELSHLKTQVVPLSTQYLYLASIDEQRILEQEVDEFIMFVDLDSYDYKRLPFDCLPWTNASQELVAYVQELGDNSSLFLHWYSVIEDVLLSDRHSSLVPIFKSLVLRAKSGELLKKLHEIACLRAKCNANIGRIFSCISDVLALEAGPEGGLRSGPALNQHWMGPFKLLEEGNLEDGIVALSNLRTEHKLSSPLQLTRLARHYEAAAQICIRKVVSNVRQYVVMGSEYEGDAGAWSVFESAARIDVAGGWSDTPPITYDYGGAVFNMAVKIDGKMPVSAKCRATKTPNILCRIICQSEIVEEIVFEHMAQICYSVPSAPGALICACLVCAKVVDPSCQQSLCAQIESYLHNDYCGLELECRSNLPQGSGMGTSSILAGCILSVIWKANGTTIDQSSLLHAVLYVEQLLTTGGGWQDQVGGLIPGLKLGRFTKSVDNPKIEMERVQLDCEQIKALDDRLILVYTGKTRLAKNLLQDVIRKWYGREPIILDTVQKLVANAEKCLQCAKIADWDGLAECARIYREQKKIMATGSEPRLVTKLIDLLFDQNLISAGWLAGAGGGGFLYLITKTGIVKGDIETSLKQACLTESGFRTMTVHSVSIEI